MQGDSPPRYRRIPSTLTLTTQVLIMKKKFISAPAILLAAAMFTASCGGNAGKGVEANDSLTFDSIKVDSTLSLTEDTAGPRCHVSLCLTYAKGKNAELINDSIIRSGVLSPDYFSITSEKIAPEVAVDSFVKRYLAEYKKDYGEMYKALGEPAASLNCEYIVKTYVLDDNDKYFTYIANVYMYGGGAHGSSVVVARNIDASTGKIVSLKELFVPGYEQELNDLIVKALCEKYEVKDLEGLHGKTIFSGIDVYAPDNFIIGTDDITFIYSPDEIASHAEGEIRVAIKNGDMERLLKK